MDLGAGDARYTLAIARADPGTFAVAVEPAPEQLRETARSLLRHPLPNAALIVATVEDAAPIGALGDELTVHFPWGPLLDAVLGRDAGVLDAIAQLARRDATLRVVTSLTERDGRGALPDPAALGAAYRRAGLDVVALAPAGPADVAATRSSWAKRIGAGRSRPAFVIDAVRR